MNTSSYENLSTPGYKKAIIDRSHLGLYHLIMAKKLTVKFLAFRDLRQGMDVLLVGIGWGNLSRIRIGCVWKIVRVEVMGTNTHDRLRKIVFESHMGDGLFEFVLRDGCLIEQSQFLCSRYQIK